LITGESLHGNFVEVFSFFYMRKRMAAIFFDTEADYSEVFSSDIKPQLPIKGIKKGAYLVNRLPFWAVCYLTKTT
jgi:hypothetical protein